MDKLKPLITHHFWIVFGAVLLLPIVGWWPAAGAFKTETDDKISKIDQAFSKVPTGAQENQSWSDEVNKIAEKAEQQNQEQRNLLWHRQWEMMTWPNTISKVRQPKTYRADIGPTARNIYKNTYNLEVIRVWQSADPFDHEKEEGTVLLSLATIPRKDFGTLPPTSEEMWDVQEDLWLLESLLLSIKEANQGTTLVSDSLVRSVDVINLVGGPGSYPNAEPASSNGGGTGGPGSEEIGVNIEGPPSGFGDPDGGGQRPGSQNNQGGGGSVGFDPSDEFGEEQGRYIDFAEGTIYRKRGFYIEAIIDHERLPELLVALSNGSWPVTITRVQMAKKKAGSGNAMQGRGNTGGAFSTSSPFGEDDSQGEFGPPSGEAPFNAAGPTSPLGNANSSPSRELSRAALNGNNLAHVAISGVIYMYNPPPVAEGITLTEEPSSSETTNSEAAPDEATTPATPNTEVVPEPTTEPAKPVESEPTPEPTEPTEPTNKKPESVPDLP